MAGANGNLLLEWALNLMVLNVSTRNRAGLPEGDLAKARGDGTSKSAASRRFVALSRKKMKAWLASDLSELDLLVIQIDGLLGDHVLMARSASMATATSMSGRGRTMAGYLPTGEHGRIVQALIDNLLARGLDPTLPRMFIVDGARHVQADPQHLRCGRRHPACRPQGPNIIERPQHLHRERQEGAPSGLGPGRRKQGRAALGNLARRLEHEEPAHARLGHGILEAWSDPHRHPPRCRTNSGARSPAPTSRTVFGTVSSARSPATSNAGDTPRWRSDGPPPACWRPRKPSVASRPSPAAQAEISPGTLEMKAQE